MAYTIVNTFRGGSEEQYDAVRRVVHPDDGETLPEGQTHHFAGSSGDDWVVIAVWDSEERWTEFRDGTLMPALQRTEGTFERPPEVIEFETERAQSA